MKNILIMLMLCSGMVIAQQGINYKAIISDDGAVIQNQQVAVSFTILEDGITIVYKELHVLNTDANGLIITNIGEGVTTLGDFETIDWSNEQFLQVEVDTGSGNVDLGTTAFKNVPYALHAKTATTITGPLPDAGNLEKITEDNKTGYRLADANPNFYGDIGINAVDLSIPLAESSSAGATGNSSFASGFKTTASGSSTTAMGSYGAASGGFSTAIGYEVRASGNYSTAMGRYTTAESFTQTTIGMYNTAASESVGTFVSTDRLFVIGNGQNSSNKSDALIVLKSGDTEINGQLTIDAANDNTGYTLPSAKGDSGQVLAMNETDSGTHWKSAGNLAKITEGANTGYRLADANPNAYGDTGAHAVDLSFQPGNSSTLYGATGDYAFAAGFRAIASGDYSTALGLVIASGDFSTAMGTGDALGDYSTATGKGTIASGDYSTAMGYSSIASGSLSTAMGLRTTAGSLAQTTLGTYNADASGTVDSFVATDRLFVIGNGIDQFNKSDAMVVLKNGNTTINGALNVNEVHDDDSGDADMKAYVYGLVGKDGSTSVSSSDGFLESKVSTGYYKITFDVPMSRTSYVGVATLHDSIGFIKLTRQHNFLEVRTYNTSGGLSDSDFYFVVYKK